MGDSRCVRAWLRGLSLSLLALIALLVPVSSAFAQDDEPDDPPAAAPAPADDDPPAAAPAAADDDKPAAPAAADADGDADNDGKPDAPAPAAADADGDADNDGKPDAPAAADADGDGKPDAPAADADGDGKPDAPAADADGDGKPDAPVAAAADTDPGPGDTSDDTGAFDPSDDAAEAAADDADDVKVTVDEDGEPYIEADADGDGVVSAEELAGEKEFDTAFADIPDEVSDDALDARPEDAELVPSIGIDQFRQLVKLAKRKVLERLEAKIAKKADARMKKIAMFVSLFSLVGLLLLAMPLFLARRYPGQMGNLFKYSAIAALTFVVTVNLFGGIMLGMRSVQSAVGSQTNPQLRLAAGFFDTLDHNAARYVVTGRELFAPTLEALDGKSDEQPAAVLIANGQKIVEKATIFKQVAGMFQKVSFIFGALPIVLLAVTMILFIVAIKPTLMEIINLPATAAAGAAGASSGVVGRALRRVGGELLATVCTLGVLIVLSLLAGFVMGRVVEPMLDTLITCFARALDYLQFVADASPAKVGMMLFSVILALVFNLAVVILSMSFFLGKTQKIFQQRFSDGVPLAAHARWWKWGVPSVLFALLLPLAYLAVAKLTVGALERKIMASVTDAEKVNWSALLLATPGLLVVGFVVFLWAARGVKALGFLATYKVKLAAPPPV